MFLCFIAVSRVLCKFFAHGACLKGENCDFSHDWKDPPNNICTFYQKGNCAYGSQCRYAHVKVSQLQSPASSSVSHPHQYPGSAAVPHTPATVSDGASTRSGAYASDSTLDEHFVSMISPVWSEKSMPDDLLDGGTREPTSVDRCDRPLCSFAAAGDAHRTGTPQEKTQKHICEKRQTRLESLKQSQEIECSVCLERVLGKPTAAERKFGILSECDHPFCVVVSDIRKFLPASAG
ncbi:hypothetical protein Leryth_002148 [Lithospermum erythrorhizon]|nr:hypothetical protein Leryth_002148 [Lithospermum erythrorhizon]